MSEYLPREVRDGLEEARKRDLRRRARWRVMAGDDVYPILRMWDEGFALDAEEVSQLRGLVDVYDGARHVSQCLIIASDVSEGELICTMKRATHAIDAAPVDFERDEAAPVALIPQF
ncbi:MAG: hypothetical protein NXH83_12095 [Rhodobacteraceae bacterium]|nr:hypothetical protein [Paracoccaceae bacterium]